MRRKPGRIRVDVAFALRERQALISLDLDRSSTVEQAIRRSGILDDFPEIDIARSQVGIFGRLASLETRVRDGDRVEIYRPLIAEPKQARRERAQRAANKRKK
jgi:putative ubiquitin-RnfH superfamily antitoxin RatB of RatAB toxin-antitoxin module